MRSITPSKRTQRAIVKAMFSTTSTKNSSSYTKSYPSTQPVSKRKKDFYSLSKKQKRFAYAFGILIFTCIALLSCLAAIAESSDFTGWMIFIVVVGGLLGWLGGVLVGVILYFFNMIVRKEPDKELLRDPIIQDHTSLSTNYKSLEECALEEIDKTNAKIFMDEFHDSLDIMKKTSEPSTFFSRYDLLMERLDNMIELQQKGIKFTGDLSELKNLSLDQENIADTVNVLIDNAYNKQLKKLSTLKTERGRENSNNRWYASFEPYFDKMPSRSKTYLDLKLEALKEV